MVFAYKQYEQGGGLCDVAASFDGVEDALIYCDPKKRDESVVDDRGEHSLFDEDYETLRNFLDVYIFDRVEGVIICLNNSNS